MIELYIGLGVFTMATGAWYFYRKGRRERLEQRQLEMFIEELVWDPDDGRWVVDDTEEIRPLKSKKV